MKFLEDFKNNNPDKQLILLFKAGSHFFDLNGPNSDIDYRGIYICPNQDCFDASNKTHMIEYNTNQVKNTKNTAGDIDFTLFSFSSFLKLLRKGDFNMMEILYCPEDKILFKTPLYDELVKMRSNLIVNDVSAFIGFIKKEYKRYGCNIYHYKTQYNFIQFLKQFHIHDPLKKHWSAIKKYAETEEGIRFSQTMIDNSGERTLVETIVIAERMHQGTAKCGYVVEAMESIISNYGHRQKNMAQSGVEYKGLYHALRLIYEANDIFDTGELSFPFSKERYDTLYRVKNSLVTTDYIFNLIDGELHKLQTRYKNTVTNRARVEYTIDKIEYTLKGRMELWQHNLSLH